ncbi:MAG: VOC family protein [Acidobacteriota bacterium]
MALDGGPATVFLSQGSEKGRASTMRLNQVTLPARDVERSTRFYLLLGLHLIVDAAPRYVRFECPPDAMPQGDGKGAEGAAAEGGGGGLAAGPPSTLSLHREVFPEPAAAAALPGITLYFEVIDVDAEVERLRVAGVEIESEPQDQRWLWREASVRDPDGHRIILYHAGEARRFPPWRLDPPRRGAEPTDGTAVTDGALADGASSKN